MVIDNAWVKECLVHMGKIGKTKSKTYESDDNIGSCDVIVNKTMHHFCGLMDNGTVEKMITRYRPVDIMSSAKKVLLAKPVDP